MKILIHAGFKISDSEFCASIHPVKEKHIFNQLSMIDELLRHNVCQVLIVSH